MAVTVDQKPLRVVELGLRTVGQVLSHLLRENRLIVHMLIDGCEPDLGRMSVVRREQVDGHELFIETADPRELVREALGECREQLNEADRLRVDATLLLARNAHVKAMEKLSGCFSTWQNAQESILKTAQLLKVDINEPLATSPSLSEMLADFTLQLREMKRALETRDFVSLNDILTYEAPRTNSHWRSAIESLLKLCV